MKFTWDHRKRIQNIKEHSLDFTDAEKVFDGHELTTEDDRFFYSERRFLTLGLLAGLPVAITHTFEEEHVHVISFRKATRRESQRYFSTFPKLD